MSNFDRLEEAKSEREAGTYVDWSVFGAYAPIIAATKPFAQLLTEGRGNAEGLRAALAKANDKTVMDFAAALEAMGQALLHLRPKPR